MVDDHQPIAVGFVRGMERNGALDAAAERLRRWAGRVVPGGCVGEELRGRSLGHPLHAALTDVPIGFWTSAAILDVLGGPGGRTAARRFVGAGVLSTIPAALAGLADVSRLSVEGRRVVLVHVALNTTAFTCYATSWVLRGSSHRSAALGAAWIGAIAASASAFLGGHIAHHRGEPNVAD